LRERERESDFLRLSYVQNGENWQKKKKIEKEKLTIKTRRQGIVVCWMKTGDWCRETSLMSLL